MTKQSKALVVHWLGMLICIVPPIIAVLEYFPLWLSDSESTLSVFSVVLLVLCCLPFWKQIKAYFKGTPAAWVIWLIITVIFKALAEISGDIGNVAFIALLSNLVGGLIFRLEKRIRKGS
jgi:hypothetical protein